MIENKDQLKDAEGKIKDLCSLAIESYETLGEMDNPMVFNAMIGELIKRMGDVQKDIHIFLK